MKFGEFWENLEGKVVRILKNVKWLWILLQLATYTNFLIHLLIQINKLSEISEMWFQVLGPKCPFAN